MRKSRSGKESMKTLWLRVPPALQLQQVFRAAVGRQMRRSHEGGITIKSAVAVLDKAGVCGNKACSAPIQYGHCVLPSGLKSSVSWSVVLASAKLGPRCY